MHVDFQRVEQLLREASLAVAQEVGGEALRAELEQGEQPSVEIMRRLNEYRPGLAERAFDLAEQLQIDYHHADCERLNID